MALERNDILTAIKDSGGAVVGNKIVGGSISRAAKWLGVARRTLQNRMRFYGIPTGTAGRRKKKISYSRGAKRYAAGAAIGAAAVAAVIGGAVIYRKRPPSSTPG